MSEPFKNNVPPSPHKYGCKLLHAHVPPDECRRVDQSETGSFPVGHNSDIAGLPGLGLTAEDAACLSDETANEIRRMAEIPLTDAERFPEDEGPDGKWAGRAQVAKWADEAMYTATPLAEEDGTVKPRVTLVSMTPDPLRVIGAVCEMYKGHPVGHPGDITQEQAIETFHSIAKTTLQAPFEFVDLHFLIEGVSRGFTHQMVRQRTAVFAQESTRFAVKEDFPVTLPPSLEGLADDDPRRVVWDSAVFRLKQSYLALVEGGVPAEDARGLLPTNIATRLHYKTNLRNLGEHAGMRLCSQAQHEWKLVWREMIAAILGYGPPSESWQQREIVRLFKPVCYSTGKCEFMADIDRYCSIRDRVEAHHLAGDAPSTWTDINPLEPLHHEAARRPR
jgi:flavin-dependent thymidylate synthase